MPGPVQLSNTAFTLHSFAQSSHRIPCSGVRSASSELVWPGALKKRIEMQSVHEQGQSFHLHLRRRRRRKRRQSTAAVRRGGGSNGGRGLRFWRARKAESVTRIGDVYVKCAINKHTNIQTHTPKIDDKAKNKQKLHKIPEHISFSNHQCE